MSSPALTAGLLFAALAAPGSAIAQSGFPRQQVYGAPSPSDPSEAWRQDPPAWEDRGGAPRDWTRPLQAPGAGAWGDPVPGGARPRVDSPRPEPYPYDYVPAPAYPEAQPYGRPPRERDPAAGWGRPYGGVAPGGERWPPRGYDDERRAAPRRSPGEDGAWGGAARPPARGWNPPGEPLPRRDWRDRFEAPVPDPGRRPRPTMPDRLPFDGGPPVEPGDVAPRGYL